MSKKLPQPAIKSYFFDKGYKDLRDTIVDSWKRNLASAKGFWGKAEGFWAQGGPHMLLAVGAAFAALSVVVFGSAWFLVLSLVHIVILFIFFSIIYLAFTFLWAVERTYMFWHGIFVVCPYCHEKYNLPFYLCPNCNTAHTRLIPGSYGILKRTCLCGEILPTTFYNGRKKLEAKCPNANCSRTIDVEITKPICVPIIGGPSVGKTCFLAASTKDLVEKIAPRNSWKIRFTNKQNENLYKRIISDYRKGIAPAKTVDLTPTAFNFFIGSNDWSPEKIMYFYDSAGEAFQNTDQLVSHKFYGFLHGFIFIIDPFSIPELLDDYKSNLKLYNTRLKPSDLMLEDCFDAMVINLEKNHRIKQDKRIKMPCAIIINKVDAFDLEDRIGEAAARRLMMKNTDIPSIDHAVNQLCEELFLEWSLGNFLRKLKHKFKRYRFFTCSALGRMPGGVGRPFQPYRVSEPLMWLLGQADKNLRA